MDMIITHHLCLLHVAKLFKINIYLHKEKVPFCTKHHLSYFSSELMISVSPATGVY